MTSAVFLRVALAVGTGAVVAALAFGWWSRTRCEGECARAEREARAMFERGEWTAALERIDETDAHCNCSRFTEGDEPPEHSLAVACVRELVNHGREAEVRRIISNARGRILRDLVVP